jgi:hypothetical protein
VRLQLHLSEALVNLARGAKIGTLTWTNHQIPGAEFSCVVVDVDGKGTEALLWKSVGW